MRLNGRIAAGSERVAEGDCFEFPDLTAGGARDAGGVARIPIPTPRIPLPDPRPPSSEPRTPNPEPRVPLPALRAPRLTTPHGRHLLRLYEDEAILVISKPAEVLVHCGEGGFTRRDTLEEVLRRAYPAQGVASIPRPGGRKSGTGADRKQLRSAAAGFHFVHRLDMETSGCLVIAKTEAARDVLIRAFASRAVHKEYLALVAGTMRWDTLTVRKPIKYVRGSPSPFPLPKGERGGRGGRRATKGIRLMPGQKKGVALEESSAEGKPCETFFEVAERYRGYTLLRAVPKTGRTHQIRVHLQSVGHPLALDPLYGRATALRASEFGVPAGREGSDEVILSRLPLHAWKLRFAHPETGEAVSVTAPLPRDLREFLRFLRRASGR